MTIDVMKFFVYIKATEDLLKIYCSVKYSSYILYSWFHYRISHMLIFSKGSFFTAAVDMTVSLL